MIIESLLSEYNRYKKLAEEALEQVGEDDLSKKIGPEDNSISINFFHISGNFKSRLSDFLESDGEKSWRNRDKEFVDRKVCKEELLKIWYEGWEVCLETINSLDDEDIDKIVTVRGEKLSVIDALHRSLAHTAYHVGQIVFMAKACAGSQWETMSIPRGKSEEYNREVMQRHSE